MENIQFSNNQTSKILDERIIRYTGLAAFSLFFLPVFWVYTYFGIFILFPFIIFSLLSLIFATKISKNKFARTIFLTVNIIILISQLIVDIGYLMGFDTARITM